MNISPPTRFYALSFLVKALREALLEGEWIEVLPSERELAEHFKVSRSTLRKALRILEEDGFLVISQGKPTLISVPSTIGAKAVSHRVRLCQAQSEGCVGGLEWERMAWDIKARLHAAGIEFEEINLCGPTARTTPWEKEADVASEGSKYLNVLLRGDAASERWFFDHAPHAVLLVGQGSRALGLPCVDVDLLAIGAHLGTLMVQRGFEEICLLGGEGDAVRADCLNQGLQRVLQEKNDRVTVSSADVQGLASHLPKLLKKLANNPAPLLVALSSEMVPAIFYHAVKAGYHLPRDISLVAVGEPRPLNGFGIRPASYDYQTSKMAKAVVQQVVDVMHIDGLKFQSHLFIPNFSPGETLAEAVVAKPAKRNSP